MDAMQNCLIFHLRLCILILLCGFAAATPASAHDHLTGKVVSFDQEQGIVIVQSIHDHKPSDIVTIHARKLPKALETGAMVYAHGRYRKDDLSRFDAIRVKIEEKDLTGVRKRLRKIIDSKRDNRIQNEDINSREKSD